MIRDKESLTKSGQVLTYLLAAKSLAGDVFSYPSLQKAVYPEYNQYRRNQNFDALLRRLLKQGWIKTEYKEAKQIISLTHKGELESLVKNMHLDAPPKSWDGKWRIVMFDIPEGARNIRNKLRYMLQTVGYKALQASVYVYPYPLSTAGLTYLKQSGLMRYIRIIKADFEDDADLRRLFKLKL